MRPLLAFSALCLLFSACNSDNVGEVCLPRSLRAGTDSIVFEYTNDRQLSALLYYNIWGRTLNRRLDLTYDNGRLTMVTQSQVAFLPSPRLDVTYTIEYGTDGLPSKLSEVQARSSISAKFVTEFTHDDQRRLTRGITTLQSPSFPGGLHIGGYIYEYNNDRNVTTVKYLIREFPADKVVEVLARENLTFDDNTTFYSSSNDLTTLNVYIYSQIPSVNHSLTSRVTYLSYDSHYNEPVELKFMPTYDERGRIKSYVTADGVFQSFGTVSFSLATYECF